jgi:uncharacterized protein (DUF736 family)
MKQIVLFCLCISVMLFTHGQDLDKASAMQLVSKNLNAVGISQQDLDQLVVTNAYLNKLPGTEMVYLQQTYKSVPVLNHLLVLAFRNGVLVSKAGSLYKGFQRGGQSFNATPSVSAEAAVRTALTAKKLFPTAGFTVIPRNPLKLDFGKAGVSEENITAELLWALVENKMELVWQVFLTPRQKPDYLLIRVDAHANNVVDEDNLTLYCNWGNARGNKQGGHIHTENERTNPGIDVSSIAAELNTATATSQDFSPLSPAIVNSAAYKVIPFPKENPLVAGGAPALVNNPWTNAPGNATSLKWHSDGTNDYNYTRGNNVWAYHDRLNNNSPDITRSAMSTTPADPLSFNFTPDFTAGPIQTAPVQNQQFNITNLFYWNNIIHDVVYQYGFDEVSGNFQANNQGRGGAGNDYVRAEAQDGSGTDNANFSTPPDGGAPRMQMYLWAGPTKMVVNAPASIAGNYTAIEGAMSTANQLSAVGPVTAQVVYYNDDVAGTLHEACAAPANVLTNKIALINRGTCGFAIKVKNAQVAGAVGVIMVNNVPGAPIIMGGTDNTITIPAVMVSQADGAIIAAQLANNVNVTLSTLPFDGDVDNGIVIHEFSHGISNRLTGGPANNTCLSSAEQMGEGWSDYYMLMLTQDWAGSNTNTGFTTARSVGTYANGEAPSGVGIRTQKYSTNLAVNNLMFTANLPGTNLQHTRGEIWCATLWDMTWNIIQQTNSITPSIYNATGNGGNVIALKLVTEGLKLQPCNPGFIDGRDAILKADQLLYGGVYSCAIREAFRRRGMGAFASQGSSMSTSDQTPDYSSYLDVSLTQSVTQVPEGQNIIYTTRISSCGPVTNYLLTDTLPANVTYVSGGTYNAGTRVVSFPVNFAAAGTQNYVFTVTANMGSYYAPTTYLDEQVTTTTMPATLTATTNSASVWSVSSTQSHSAPNAMYTPDDVGMSEQLLVTTNPVILGNNQSSASFWHKYTTEVGFDGGVFQLSNDGGVNWIDLDNKFVAGYYNGTIDATNGTAISGKKAFTGASTGFVNSSVDISSYAGQSVKFRWGFFSDPFEGAEGWYVDDILIKNEAVVNMRASLFNNAGTRMIYKDTVTLIVQTLVCTNAAITTQPSAITACAGSNTSFTVVATGSTLSYQWQVSTDGGAIFTNIPGATAATLSLPAVTAGMNNYRYRVIASNACPSTVTSAAATLTVTSPSVISQQPVNAATCSGNNASFSVTATGSGLTYQWQVSTNSGSTWTNITGATAATLNLSAVTIGMNNNQYRVVLSSCTPGGLTSSPATLTVNAGVDISAQPVNVTGCSGTSATFTVTAAGTALNYQWQVSTNGGTSFTNIPGANSATLTLTGITAAMNSNQYRVTVSNACPSSLNSTAAILTVTDVTVISSQPASATVCSGATTSFSVVATGTNLTYQWQVSTDGGITWTNIAAATASTLNLSSVTTAMNNNRYRVLMPSCVAGGLTSAPATLTVNAATNITSQPASTTACTGNNVTLTAVVSGSGLSYQWEVSTDAGATWTSIAGATNASLALTAVTAAMDGNRYRVTVNGSCSAGPITSNVATLTINNSITISQQPVSTTLCAGLNTAFTAAATGSGLTYQWQVSTNGGTSFSNLSGATSPTLNLPSVTPAMNGNQYRVNLGGSCVASLFTNAATLTVNSSVTIVTQPANQAGCAPVPANFSITATGTSLSFQWEVSTNSGTSWTAVAGATGTSLSIPTLTPALNGSQYRVIVTGVPCGTLTSNAATLSVGQLPAVTIAASTTAVSANQTATLTATPNPAGTYTYQWFKDNVPVTGVTSNTLVVGIDKIGVYKAIANSSNGCNNVSNEITISESPSQRLFVYPNPNYGLFHVRFYTDPTLQLARTINVYDPRGAKIFTRVYTVLSPYDRMEVNLGGVPGGVYYLELLDASGKRVASAGITKF